MKGISLIAVNGSAGYLYPANDERFAWHRVCEHTLALMADGKTGAKAAGHAPAALHRNGQGVRDGLRS